MARSTREENKTTEEQKKQIVWLLMQMAVVVNDSLRDEFKVSREGRWEGG